MHQGAQSWFSKDYMIGAYIKGSHNIKHVLDLKLLNNSDKHHKTLEIVQTVATIFQNESKLF